MLPQRPWAALIAPFAALALAAPTAWGKSATEVFERVSPSVVVVYALDQAGQATAQGSGVVIEPGVVATNCHVLEGGKAYAVAHNKRRIPARLRHADWDRDVCSLSVEGLTTPAVPLGSTRHLKVGQKVYAVGAPKGLELTLSKGIISSLRDIGAGSPYLQITAPISPGSSGGGLFDEEGRLIGLPTFYLAEGQQLNFAVPVEFVRQLPQRQAAATTAHPKGTSSKEWLHRALALQDKKDWPALQRHAQAWTRDQPDNAMAWSFLGVAYDEQGQWEKAIEAYQQALRIDPQDAKMWLGLGVAYGRQGQTAKEIEAYQQALRIDPQNAKMWLGLGAAYGRQRQLEKAIEAFQQAVRIDPQYAKAWYVLGLAYSVQQNRSKVIEVYQVLKTLDPERADELFRLAILP